MSYDTNCIEIRPDGDVIASGNLVGKIDFAGRDGILGRLYGVGVHTLKGRWPDASSEIEDLEEEIAGLEGEAKDLRDDASLAVLALRKTPPDIEGAIAILTGDAS